jgi:hypothetical protein
MMRRLIAVGAAAVLPMVLLVTLTSGPAMANPILPGTVTCGTGTWIGKVVFSPPLRNGGTAPKEKITVQAVLGNTANPCVTTSGTIELGKLKGALKYVMPSANNCATIFSGAALPASVPSSKFKMAWTTPPGAPTVWKQPSTFTVVGALAMTNIAISSGSLAGSFHTYPTPNASLSDTNWAVAVPAGCASASGLAGLTLSTSSGTW